MLEELGKYFLPWGSMRDRKPHSFSRQNTPYRHIPHYLNSWRSICYNDLQKVCWPKIRCPNWNLMNARLHQWKCCAEVHGTKSDTTVCKLFFWQDTVSCSSYLKVLFIIKISSNLFLESLSLQGSQSLLLSYTCKHSQPWPILESIFNILFYYLCSSTSSLN